MAFDTNTITIKGAELLASATAQDQLVLDGCDATQTFVTQTDAVNVSTRPATPYSTTSAVTVIGSTDNHVMCRAEFRAGVSTSGDANTLYLFGHKASAPSDVYVIYVASAQTPFYIPDVSDVISAYEALLDMIYSANADAVTTASTSVFTTLAEFNLLKERTVTTHKEGDNSEGDDQTVRGEKSFKDWCEFSDDVQFYKNVYAGKNIIPQTDDPDDPPGDFGSTTRPFAHGYVSSLCVAQINELTNGDGITVPAEIAFLDKVYADTIAEVTHNAGVTVDSILNTKSIVPVSDDTWVIGDQIHSYSEAYIITTNTNVCAPITFSGSELGTSTNQYQYCYAGGLEINDNSIGLPVSEGSTINDNVKFSYIDNIKRHDIVLKSNWSTVNLVDADAVSGNPSISAWAKFDVLLKGHQCFKIIYDGSTTSYSAEFSVPLNVSAFTGTQPTYDSDTSTRSVKVGSILMAWFSTSTPVSKTGESMHNEPGSGNVQMSYVQSSTAGISQASPATYLPAGYYVLLCDLNSTNSGAWALVQCISLD